jgi:nucleoside-diphosphate-sugar epimerase
MKNIAIIGLGWFGLPLYKFLTNKGVSCCGSTSSILKLNKLKEDGINAFLFNTEEENFTDMFNFASSISHVVVCIPPSKISTNYANELVKIISIFPESSKIIFTSSTSVYPDSIEIADENYVFSDSDLENPIVEAELLLQKTFYNRLCILRFAGLIGPQRHPAKFFAGKSNLKGGFSPVNLVHLSDCIRMVEKVIDLDLWSTIYNVCASIHPTKMEYYTKSCELLGLQKPFFDKDLIHGKVVLNDKSRIVLGKYIMDDPYSYFTIQ